MGVKQLEAFIQRLGGMPGGGAGGMPGNVDFTQVLDVPEVMESLQDPEIMGALYEIAKNPASLVKHQANPQLVPMLAKMFGKSGGGAKRNFSPFGHSSGEAIRDIHRAVQVQSLHSLISFTLFLSRLHREFWVRGCTILSTGGEEKSRVVDESDEKFFDEPKIVKPEDEIDDSGVVEPDNEPPQDPNGSIPRF